MLSRLPRHPQPVPPIFQPEVVADAILYAAERPRRREYYVGASAVATILGDKVAAGLLDRYLAKSDYNSQQAAEGVRPGRDSAMTDPAVPPPVRRLTPQCRNAHTMAPT